MRDIKFRAWSKKASKMLTAKSDELPEYLDGLQITALEMINNTLLKDDYVFLQYTGLKDKNGVDIYERDIVRHHGFALGSDVDVVEWSDGDAAYSFLGLTSEWGEHCEVIGNRFENPELLETI